MSLKCISSSNRSHVSMLSHSMAGKAHFQEIMSLKHDYASNVHGTSSYPSVTKQNDFDGIPIAATSNISEKSQNLKFQTVPSNFNGNCSTEESSVKKTFNGSQSLVSYKDIEKIPTTNAVSLTAFNPTKTATNSTSNEICSMKSDMRCGNRPIEENSVKKSSNGTQSLDSCISSNKNPTIHLVSVAASNPSQTASNGTSNEIRCVNSNVTLGVEDSFPSNAETNKTLVEGYGFIDINANAHSSKALDISDQESKVVVERVSNVGYGEYSNLDGLFDISEILEKKPCEKRWCPENKVDFIDSDESTRSSINGKEEKIHDVNQKENLSSRASSKRKMRRNHEMNFHIRPGKGIRLRDIAHIVGNVENAQPALLSFLHKVLFGTYGGSNNEDALSQTKQNILHFSGFPFSEDSEIFQTKRKCLSKVPYKMLHSMCNTLLGIGPRTRNDSVEDLLSFLQKPTNSSKSKQQLETKRESFVESELSQLKQQAIKGPYPVILLPKLNDSYVKELLHNMRNDLEEDSSSKLLDAVDCVTMTECDLPNNKIQLKALPEVVVRVNKARRRIINLLHILLYGRPGSDESNRMNILEFSGFSQYDANNYRRKKEFLRKLRNNDLDHMCSIFSLRVKSFSKVEKVIKFLHHLKASSLVTKSKKTTKLRPQTKEVIPKKTVVYSERKMKSCDPIKQLKDFEKIRRNVECASPRDLTELNDLLFLKPSDNLEIHQQILEFSSSSFRENSPEFYARRTLLYYMSFEIIRKMAALLEIADWEEYKNPQDLATTLLRFLMDMKPSAKIRRRIKPRVHGLRKISSSIHRPHLLRVQRDDSCQESDINRNLTTSAMHSSTNVKEGFHEEKCNTSVIVRRISESSYSFTDTRTNEPVTVSDSNSDESLSLYDFVKHPSDKQLEVTIREMIFTNTWSSTMGDLINRVFHCYPKLNLTYRVDFIKAKALEVLHEVQNNAESFDNVI